jgi:hypothetical protein
MNTFVTMDTNLLLATRKVQGLKDKFSEQGKRLTWKVSKPKKVEAMATTILPCCAYGEAYELGGHQGS